jgi:hypothetical protein
MCLLIIFSESHPAQNESSEESSEASIPFVPRPTLEKGITEAEIFNNYTACAFYYYLFYFIMIT